MNWVFNTPFYGNLQVGILEGRTGDGKRADGPDDRLSSSSPCSDGSGTGAETVEAWSKHIKSNVKGTQGGHVAGPSAQADPSAESAAQLRGAHRELVTALADQEKGVDGLIRREDPTENRSPEKERNLEQEQTSLRSWLETTLDVRPGDGPQRPVGNRSKPHRGGSSTEELQSADEAIPSNQKGWKQATWCSNNWGLASPRPVEQVRGGQRDATTLAREDEAERPRPRGAAARSPPAARAHEIRETQKDKASARVSEVPRRQRSKGQRASARLAGTDLEKGAPAVLPRPKGKLTGGSEGGVKEGKGGQSAKYWLRNRVKRDRRKSAQSAALGGTATNPVAVSSEDDVPAAGRPAKRHHHSFRYEHQAATGSRRRVTIWVVRRPGKGRGTRY